MTEDLWHHALQFLDKYRADALNYPIEELYQFADQTGILERHRQLLAKPFHENEVDMKIMYYELIKMLIAYEREGQSSRYDTTKTVGKIEGYQELTNRLQRYLNQRFITDVDHLKKQQVAKGHVESKPEIDGERLQQMEKRMTQLEEKFIDLTGNHSKLKKNCDSLEQTNLSLVNKMNVIEKNNKHLAGDICAMKEKNSEMIENTTNINLDQKVFENIQNQNNKHTDEQFIAQTEIIKMMKIRADKHDDELSLIVHNDASQDDKLELLDNSVDNIQVQLSALSNKLTSYPGIMENLQQKSKTPRLEARLSGVLDDILKINKDNKVMIERIEADEKRIREIEHTKCIHNDDAIRSDIAKIEAEMKSKTNTINIILDTQTSLNEQLVMFDKKCESKWESVENVMKQNDESSRDLKELVHLNKTKIDVLDSGFEDLENCCASIKSDVKMNNAQSNEVAKNFNDISKNITNKQDKLEQEISSSKELIQHHDDTFLEVKNKVINFEKESVKFANDLNFMMENTSNDLKQCKERISNLNGTMNLVKKNEENITLKSIQEEMKMNTETEFKKIENIASKYNNKLDDVIKTIKVTTLDTDASIKLLDEKVKLNVVAISRIEQSTGNLEMSISKHDERNNDTSVRMAQISLLTSNMKKEIDDSTRYTKDISNKRIDQIQNTSNKIEAELAQLSQNINNMDTDKLGLSVKIEDLEEKAKRTIDSIKQKDTDVQYCKKEIFDIKHLFSKLQQNGDECKAKLRSLEDWNNLHVQKLQEKFEKNNGAWEKDGRQATEARAKIDIENAEVERKLTNIIDTRLNNNIELMAKIKQELEERFGNKYEILLNRIQEKESKFEHEMELMVEKEKKHQRFVENIDKEILKVKENINIIDKTDQKMSKILEQTNVLMMKNATQEEKLSEQEKIQNDVENKLLNLESADVFLQEANRMLIEKLSKMEKNTKHSENSKQQGLKKEFNDKLQQNELLIQNLMKEIGDMNGNIAESKQDLELLRQIFHNMEQQIKGLNGKIKQEVIDENSEQFMELKRLIVEEKKDVKYSENEVLHFKQLIANIEQQINKLVESKQEILKFEEFKMDVSAKILEMSKDKDNFSILDDKHNQLIGHIAKYETELNDVKKCIETDQEKLVKKVSDQRESLDSFYKTIKDKFDNLEKTKNEEMKNREKLELKSCEQNSKMVELKYLVDRVEILEKARDEEGEQIEDANDKGTCMGFGKANLWTLMLEIYAAFRGYTLVVKSEGAVSEHQSDVLGVYRMVDTYNDRPVYKQEGGENYIYYSSASSSWLVGTVVGHQYGWLRNSSTAASSARWLPDLSSGWEYRPLVSLWECLEGQECWLCDDGTLRIESLRDVEKVTLLIRDMKTGAEVE
eukprot:GFUD01015609.1.p1 GENE.GFUD01015609.1~~GFUD01015609.1.p1  ORF type:complete len:1372 (-),score=525.76 GFUD01015609.1:84-4199(-)